MIRVTYSNYREVLREGLLLIYDGRSAKIVRDATWNGGFKIAGRSILNILEEYNDVMVA